LAPIHSVDHIVQAVAEALNFPLPTHENPKHQLLRYLQKKNLLLVMDNFEHLMAGAGIVSEILQNTSGVKVLATSRERLNLKSETMVNIVGMDEANQDAVALFLQSGAKAQPGFEPASDELTQIENICRFVGGMPLAIELAASWLHVLSVDEINDELKKGLDILETEVRDAPERHRSIRDVFDQSRSLLDQSEQGIFMRLSIFRGGFTRQAAQQVAGASLKQIAGLVNKSIVKRDPNTGRLELHDLLRQYAQERLESTPQADSTKEAYATYYANFMQENWRRLRGSEQISALREIEADIENVRAAWRYYLDEQNASQLKKFIHGFWLVYWIRGWVRGAIELFADCADALAQAEHDPDFQAVRASAMAHHGGFLSYVGLPDEGYKLVRKSIDILEGLDYPLGLAFAFHSMTVAAYYLNRQDEQKEAAYKFLKFAESSSNKWLLAYGLWFASFAESRVKNYQESRRLADASLKVSEEINNSFGLAWSFATLGQRAIRHGDYAEAKDYYLRSLQMARKLKFTWYSSNAIKYLGEIALLAQDTAEAQEYLTQSLKVAYDLGLERDLANLLYDFASLRVAQNKLEEGVALISLLLGQPASHLARWGGGRIRDRARTLLAKLESKLSQDVYAEALRRSELLNLDDVVVELIGLQNNVG
jgi:predicted ATPase